MQLEFVTNIVVFLVFVAAFMVFSLYPAIWLSERLQDTYDFDAKTTNLITLLLTITIAFCASVFLYI